MSIITWDFEACYWFRKWKLQSGLWNCKEKISIYSFNFYFRCEFIVRKYFNLIFFYIDFFINRPIAIAFFIIGTVFVGITGIFVSILDEFANQVCGSYSWFTGTNTQKRKKIQNLLLQ